MDYKNTIKFSVLKLCYRTGEMAQKLLAPAVLTEDPSLVPSSYARQAPALKCTYTSKKITALVT